MTVYQHIDEFQRYDGIGNDCIGFQNLFQSMGVENYILTRKNKSPEHSGVLQWNSRLVESKNDIHILHYGGSGYPLDSFLERKGRKILRFHNITPPEFFRACTPGVFLSMEKFYQKSILELQSLESRIELCLSDSDFNTRTLQEVAKIPAITVPIVRDYSRKYSNSEIRREPNLSQNNDQAPNQTQSHYQTLNQNSFQNENNNSRDMKIVYLSRIVPNKKMEDLVSLLFFVKKIQPNASLHILGSVVPGIESYFHFLQAVIADLGLFDSIVFHHRVSEEEKMAIFDQSDFFVCMSEHEGFGIPVLEAMEAGLPVLASLQVEETMKGGGILLDRKDYLRIAELMLEIQSNQNLRQKIIEGQFKALEWYQKFPWQETLQRTVLGLK